MAQRPLTFLEQLKIRYYEVRRKFNGRFTAVIIAVLLVLAFAAGYLQRPLPTDNITISTPAPNVTTVQVPVPVITEKVVTKYIRVEDQAAATALLAENDKLKIKVDQLSVSLAEAQSRGHGESTTTIIPPTATTPEEVRVTFKDWRLNFVSVNNKVNYTLTQKFSIVNTVGRDKQNVPTNLVRLYEIDAAGERVPIPVTETTTVAATANLPQTYVKLTVQGGVGYANGQRVLILTPWLKRGRSTATEDTRWAFVTPAISLAKDEQAVGIAPVSFNLGSLPRQPLTNLWVSPFVGTTTGIGINQKGVAISVTF
jgi:hypothetical protein